MLSAPRVQLDPLDPLVHKETTVLMDLQAPLDPLEIQALRVFQDPLD